MIPCVRTSRLLNRFSASTLALTRPNPARIFSGIRSYQSDYEPPKKKSFFEHRRRPSISINQDETEFLKKYFGLDKEERNNNRNFFDDNNNNNNEVNKIRLLLMAILGLNVGVFVLWGVKGRDIAGVRWMENHFSASMRNIKEGRLYTILTSAFSHPTMMHLIANMMAIMTIGQSLAFTIGARGLSNLYFWGATCSSLFHIFYQNVLVPKYKETPLMKSFGLKFPDMSFDTPAVGASGAGMAIATCFAFAFPKATLQFFFFPAPAWLLIGGLVAFDIYSAFSFSDSHISHVGHVGGAFYGAFYYLTRMRGRMIRF